MKTFLDPDWEPPAELKAEFEAGRQAEQARANSPEEQAKWNAVATVLGKQIADGVKRIVEKDSK